MNYGLQKFSDFFAAAENKYQPIVLIYLYMIHHVIPEPLAEFHRQGVQFLDFKQETTDGVGLFHFISALGLYFIQLLRHRGVAGQVVVSNSACTDLSHMACVIRSLASGYTVHGFIQCVEICFNFIIVHGTGFAVSLVQEAEDRIPVIEIRCFSGL